MMNLRMVVVVASVGVLCTQQQLSASASSASSGGSPLLMANSTDGRISLTFNASSGRLLYVESTPANNSGSSATLRRMAVDGAGRSMVAMDGVGDGAQSANVSTTSAGSVCIQRVVGPLEFKQGRPSVTILDCFAASGHSENAVQWTSTISSNSSSLFSVQIGRGLFFTPRTAQGEQIWSGSDNTTHGREYLLDWQSQAQLGHSVQWLGGYLTTSGLHGTSGAYAFKGPTISFPAAMTADAGHDAGLVLALDLHDRLSTRLSLNTTFSSTAGGFGFSYGAYRLGANSEPLVFHADIAVVAADPRAALQYLTRRWPSFFVPAVPAARTLASGTGWYTKCGPAVGGCDLQGSNASYAAQVRYHGSCVAVETDTAVMCVRAAPGDQLPLGMEQQFC
jgi:hypothetical protein